MKDELYTRLEKYLDALEKAVVETTNFSLDQASIVVQEFVLYHRTWSAILVVFLLAWAAGTACYARWKIQAGLGPDKQPPVWVCVAVSCLVWGLYAAQCVPYALKAWLAPRVLLLEQIGKML